MNLLLAKKDNGGIDKPEMGVNPIPNSLDHFADEKSVERLNGYILSLIQGLNDGLTSDETIKEANLRYRKKWYLESIVEFG